MAHSTCFFFYFYLFYCRDLCLKPCVAFNLCATCSNTILLHTYMLLLDLEFNFRFYLKIFFFFLMWHILSSLRTVCCRFLYINNVFAFRPLKYSSSANKGYHLLYSIKFELLKVILDFSVFELEKVYTFRVLGCCLG